MSDPLPESGRWQPSDLSRRGLFRRLGVAAAAGAGAALGSSVLGVAPASASPGVGFNVKDYGAVGDGQADDTAAVQAAVNAAGAAGGGTVFWPAGCLTNVVSCVHMPAKGGYQLLSAGPPSSIYAVNDYMNNGRVGVAPSGIIVRGIIGDQPADSALTGLQFVFDCSAATDYYGSGELTLLVQGLTFYDFAVRAITVAFDLTNRVYNFDCNWCSFQNCAIAYGGSTGGGPQMQRLNVLHCQGSNAFGLWCPNWGPFGGDISGNVWGECGDSQMPPGCHGSFLHAGNFWTWIVHDNFFFGQTHNGTLDRAWIWADNLAQTENGGLHDNCYYGASGRCIYWKNDNSSAVDHLSSGLNIHDEQFCGWNQSNIAGSTGSAVKIDHSAATSPDQIITIGKNNWVGGQMGGANHSSRGLEIIDNPATCAVIFDHEQNMRFITTAPYSINGVDYGAAGSSHRFHAVLTAPAIPGSTRPLTNPFGFDATVYISGGGVGRVAIDGTTTGLVSGLFRVPRDATITITYTRAPRWVWFAD